MVLVFISIQMEIYMKEIGIKMNKMVYKIIMLGQGTYKFSNGSVYVGNFKNGQPHGEGALDYSIS